jgi:sugar phosphate permease
VLRSRTLWCYGASYFCIKLIRYSLLFWLPYYLSEGLGYTGENAGYLSTAFEAGGVIGVIAIGIVSDRLRRFSRALLALVSLLALAAALSLYASVAIPSTVVNVAGFALIGATLFGPDSLISGAAAQDEGGRYGAATATGFVNGMGSVGAVLQGSITVLVSETYGWRALFVVFIGLSVLGAITLIPALRKHSGATEPALTRS